MKIANPIARLGEDLAVRYLQKKGYQIVGRNFRQGYGEIDIIAITDSTVVFIEVKTRRSNKYGTALEAITPWKLHALERTAMYFMRTHPKLPEQMRIDAISVSLHETNKASTIEHVVNISM